MRMQGREDKTQVALTPDMTRGDETQNKSTGMAWSTGKVRAFIHGSGGKAEHMGTYAYKLVDLEEG